MTICDACKKDCRITYTLNSIPCPDFCAECFRKNIIGQGARNMNIDKNVGW